MADERLWNSNYCKVMVANFALFFAFYVLTPLLPLYLSEHFGATYGTGHPPGWHHCRASGL